MRVCACVCRLRSNEHDVVRSIWLKGWMDGWMGDGVKKGSPPLSAIIAISYYNGKRTTVAIELRVRPFDGVDNNVNIGSLSRHRHATTTIIITFPIEERRKERKEAPLCEWRLRILISVSIFMLSNATSDKAFICTSRDSLAFDSIYIFILQLNLTN